MNTNKLDLAGQVVEPVHAGAEVPPNADFGGVCQRGIGVAEVLPIARPDFKGIILATIVS